MNEIWLSLAVLIFGLLVLAGEIGLMIRSNQKWDNSTIRLTGVTLCVVLGVFLITAGYSHTQIGPVIGLLGTIVGFLLGKTDK